MSAGRNASATAWVVTLIVAFGLMAFLPTFFTFIDGREGTMPFEPLLAHLPAKVVTIPLFVVLYSTLLVLVVLAIRSPLLVLRTIQAALILLLFRMAMMAMFPLVAPPGLITLQDPLTQLFYPTSEPFEKDLFFSGHTANMFLFALAVPSRNWRLVFLAAAAFVAAAVLVQHVHWTVDVVAAPFFAVLAWWFSKWTMVLSTR